MRRTASARPKVTGAPSTSSSFPLCPMREPGAMAATSATATSCADSPYAREPVGPTHTATGTGDAATADGDAERRRYDALVGRIRGIVRDRLPADAAVLVVSRGDDELLRLFGRRGGHFPQTTAGVYAGHHPADAAAASSSTWATAVAGWDHLLVPATAFWWFEHYGPFAAHLRRFTAIVHDDADCVIFALHEESPWTPLAGFVEAFKQREGRFPAILDWAAGCGAATVFPDVPVFSPPDPGSATLPYVEESIDVIVVPVRDDARMQEARRVATAAVVEVGGDAAGGKPQCVVQTLGRYAPLATSPARIVPTGRPALESGGRLP